MPTDIFGLKFRPSVGDSFDALDWSNLGNVNGQVVDMNYKHEQIKVEFSDNNKKALLEVMSKLQTESKLNSIIEIGVNRSGEVSSTVCMLGNKPKETKYFGIDLMEHNLSNVRNHEQNVFCLATNSSNFNEIMNFCRGHGVDKFDLVLIDGYHSINQVMDDWRLVQHLNVGGYVVMHDTNYHPGPFCVYEAIDEEYFEKVKHFTDLDLDWGIAVANCCSKTYKLAGRFGWIYLRI